MREDYVWYVSIQENKSINQPAEETMQVWVVSVRKKKHEKGC